MNNSILIVEDSLSLRSSYETFFKRAGFQVYTAENGMQGLAAMRENQPQIVLLDLMMPDVHGLTVLKQAKAEPLLAGIPIIILTALVADLERDECLRAGAVSYIEKDSLDLAQLLAEVQRILGVANAPTPPVIPATN